MAKQRRLVFDKVTLTQRRAKKPGPPKRRAKKRREVQTGRVRKPIEEAQKKRRIVAEGLAMGLTQPQALVRAGYSPKNDRLCRTPEMRRSVAEIREELRHQPGYTLGDSAGFYKTISETETEETSDRLRARGRLDALLGHDAAKQVNVKEERSELHKAVLILSNLNVTPADLLRLAGDDVGDAVVVDGGGEG